MFFVRNLYIWLISFALIVSGVFLFLSGSAFYSDLEVQLSSTYTKQLRTTLPALLEMQEGKNYKPGNKALQDFINGFAGDGSLYFARVVDTKSGRILASTKKQDIGSFYEDWVDFRRGRVLKQDREIAGGEESITSLTYKKEGELALWIALSNTYLQQKTLIYLFKLAILLGGIIISLFVLFFFLEKRYLLKPMRELRNTMKELGKDKFIYSEKNMPESLGGLLVFFNTIAEDIKNVVQYEKKSAEMKTEFISTTTHQLRTPLSGINWALESLKIDPENTLTDNQKKLIGRAHKKSQELIEMIKNLLMTSGLEEGKLNFHYENFDIIELARSIIEEEQKKAQEANVELDFKALEKESLTVKADKERIKWVFRNLIENAIRYTNEEGKVRVEMAMQKQRRELLVSVADTGMGIVPENQPHVFEKFYRSKRAIQKHNEGNGLGLFIVKKIVEHHKGQIWFETKQGEGTTFYFTLSL